MEWCERCGPKHPRDQRRERMAKGACVLKRNLHIIFWGHRETTKSHGRNEICCVKTPSGYCENIALEGMGVGLGRAKRRLNQASQPRGRLLVLRVLEETRRYLGRSVFKVTQSRARLWTQLFCGQGPCSSWCKKAIFPSVQVWAGTPHPPCPSAVVEDAKLSPVVTRSPFLPLAVLALLHYAVQSVI